MGGFLYYFFYHADGVVRAALRRHGVSRTLAAQVDRCIWNYSKDHLMYKYLLEDPVAKAPDAQHLLFRCSLGTLGHPRIVHKLDEAMREFLLQNRSAIPDRVRR